MRQLVTREKVLEVKPIADADAIEAIVVRGWQLVSKKHEFTAGDDCIYFEIDAALPISDARFAFLAARGTKTTVEGNVVHVLKTARMRGVYSQGLALPARLFPELADAAPDADLAALLGVEKWEPPLPASLAAEFVGPFPTELARKTDAERVQNLTEVYDRLLTRNWIATEKIDGTSVTFIKDGGQLRVCSRNWELVDGANVYWDAARDLQLHDQLTDGEVVQAEIYGEGIQANPLAVRGRKIAVFGFFRQRLLVGIEDWPHWLVPLAAPRVNFTLPASVDDLLRAVDGIKSAVNPERLSEGIVFHTADGSVVPELDNRGWFKAISNKYLIKHG